MALTNLPKFGLLSLVVFIGACASSPSGSVWPYPEPPESGGWGYESNPRRTGQAEQQQSAQPNSNTRETAATPEGDSQNQTASSTHPTVMKLVTEAEQHRSEGQLDQAAAKLERAIRLVNNDPLPWLKLAEVRYEQANFIQAENLARRSISFASQGPVARDAWLLIADIKRLQGNTAAAREAEANARQQ